MNYRHAFHAGNFADVVKHATLARIIAHLKEKPAAFRVIDTHAGAGLYDLAGPEASRTGEWRDGIGKLLDAALAPAARELLAPYLDAVAALNPGSAWRSIPDRPRWCAHWLRPQDRLIACELEPAAARALAAAHARRQPRQGGHDRRLDGAQRLCAAEGAARPRADRSAVRAAGRVRPARQGARRRPIANGRPASTCSGIRSRMRARRTRSRAASRGSALPRILRAELTRGAARDRAPARRQRADPGQSALAARGRARASCCRGWRRRSRAGRDGDAGRLARRRKMTGAAVRLFPAGSGCCLL